MDNSREESRPTHLWQRRLEFWRRVRRARGEKRKKEVDESSRGDFRGDSDRKVMHAAEKKRLEEMDVCLA